MHNYYKILGVGENATEQEIKSAFRKRAFQFHPDRNPDDKNAEEKFKLVNEAHRILNNTEERRIYQGNWQREQFKNAVKGDDVVLPDIELDLTLKKCPVCYGNGMSRQIYSMKCEYCGGKGIIERDLLKPDYNYCKYCYGTGRDANEFNRKLGHYETCAICEGVGQLPKDFNLWKDIIIKIKEEWFKRKGAANSRYEEKTIAEKFADQLSKFEKKLREYAAKKKDG